jgi:hypothetical protein
VSNLVVRKVTSGTQIALTLITVFTSCGSLLRWRRFGFTGYPHLKDRGVKGYVETTSTSSPLQHDAKKTEKRRTLKMNHGIVLDSVCCCVANSPSFVLVNQQSSCGAAVTAAALPVTNSGATWLQIFITRIFSTKVPVECQPAALPTPRTLQVTN